MLGFPCVSVIARVDQEVSKNIRRFNKVMEIIKGKLLLPFFMVITFGIKNSKYQIWHMFLC